MASRLGAAELAVRRSLLRGLGASLAPLGWRFRVACRHAEAAQSRVRADIARRLAATDYGRHLGVRGVRDFDRVPVVDYDELEPWLHRQRAREGAVLTPEPVLFYEKTSGSSGPAKYIPYTASLRRSFSRMFAVWASDLIRRGPGLATGKMYMSVSPSFSQEPATDAGVPVGMADDRDYLDGWLRHLVSPFIVGAADLAHAPNAAAFKHRTCEALVAEADLEIISVWNPSFLKVLLDDIGARRHELIGALGSRLSPERRDALLADPVDWPRLWPRLLLVSCWASAAAGPQARSLARLLPHAMLQGKGLLATEAPITIPLVGAPGYAPLVNEVLIELETDGGALVPLHRAELGREYGLVISQTGGLYRYRMGDRVRAGALLGKTPTLDFLGRDGGVCDLVGEKLSERFVSDVLARIEPSAFFKTLIPVGDGDSDDFHYVLLLDDANEAPPALADTLDRALSQAHHYQHARALGQLGAPRVCVAPDAAALATDDYVARGMKLGDIKPRALHTGPVAGALAARLSPNLQETA